MRIGIGYDIHRLVEGRPLILGGIHIPFEKGLQGHSDADALIHALCDAMLGAAAMGDIGMHFPDTDPRFKGIYSIELLEATWRMVSREYQTIVNIDATIFAQAPRMGPHRQAMTEKLAGTLGIESSRVNIKATTTEGLGLVGTESAISAMCVILLDL